MTKHYDAIVVGGGVVGAATLYHLARLGAGRTLLVERGRPGEGGTAKSCAIVRTHYSIPSNTELANASLAMFRDFPAALEDEEAESGFQPTGYLIVARTGDQAEMLVSNLAVQREHGADTEEVSIEEARRLHPLLDLDDAGAVGYEPDSGYADPHLTTTSFVKAAERLGAEVVTGTPVSEVIVEQGTARGVRAGGTEYHADTVVSAVGPWTRSITDPLGIEIPLEVSRHTVLTFRAGEPYDAGYPIVKDLTVENKMYFRPESGGVVLVGTGDHGEPVSDPDDMDVPRDDVLVARQGDQLAHRMPTFERASVANAWFGPYDITPDWNPVLDAAPGVEGLYLAFGFSGHGFKLAPMVGKVLAQKVLGLECDIDITPYRFSRFAEGKELVGTYGIGSIS